MPARRKSKDTLGVSCIERRSKSSATRKERCRSHPASKESPSMGLALLEGLTRGYRSLSSSPFSSPPSSPASGSTLGGSGPSRRERATERERNRMHQLNDAYDDLRAKVQTLPCSEKPSKIQTLRLAMEYIAELKDTLENDESLGDVESYLTSDSSVFEDDKASEGVSSNGVLEDVAASSNASASRSPSRSSASSSSSCEPLLYRPPVPSALTHFITHTTSCATGHSADQSHSQFQQRRVVSAPESAATTPTPCSPPPLPHFRPTTLATFPVSVSVPYTIPQMTTESTTVDSSLASAMSYRHQVAARDPWSTAHLNENSLLQDLSEAQMTTLLSELSTSASLDTLFNAVPPPSGEEKALSLLDRALLQPTFIPVANGAGVQTLPGL